MSYEKEYYRKYSQMKKAEQKYKKSLSKEDYNNYLFYLKDFQDFCLKVFDFLIQNNSNILKRLKEK